MSGPKLVQSVFSSASFGIGPFLPWPRLLRMWWDILLGPEWQRDPLETHGDAALRVVMFNLVMKVLREFNIDPSKWAMLRKAVLPPLQSNTTLLLMLDSRGLFDGEGLPKFPANSAEVYFAAVALQDGLPALENWLGGVFRPVILQALEAAAQFHGFTFCGEKMGSGNIATVIECSHLPATKEQNASASSGAHQRPALQNLSNVPLIDRLGPPPSSHSVNTKSAQSTRTSHQRLALQNLSVHLRLIPEQNVPLIDRLGPPPSVTNITPPYPLQTAHIVLTVGFGQHAIRSKHSG
ncbi:hypothetical protein R3P38DRAFT_2799581 [Favolaschia claudopus]|uniref:Uncharacterized protein n=1 Tax=Favolaschia claudopus TaxID=2862362 RepID=A0AAV9ZZW2_9AGAR